MGKISREFRLGGLSPCGKQDYPPVGNVFVFHSSVIFSHLTHVFFLFNHYVFCFFSIYFFFSFLCRWVSHHIPKRERKNKKNPKSRSKSVEACLPNKCVCPRVCPTASSPKAQALEPPLTIQFDVLYCCLPNVFSCHQSCGVLHGILVHDWSPPRIKTIFCFCKFTGTVSKMPSWKSPNKCAKFGS